MITTSPSPPRAPERVAATAGAEASGDALAEDSVDALFHALADRTRRDILRRVLTGEHSVTALAQNYDMSFAAVQKHVAVLQRAGLVSKRRAGRRQLASGEMTAVRSVASLLTELEEAWAGRVARIDALLAEAPATPSTTTARATTKTRATTTTRATNTRTTEE